MEDNNQLKVFLGIIRKRIILFIILVILACTISYVYTTYHITPVYNVSTKLLIKGSGANDQQLSRLLNTYGDIIRSSRILDLVSSEYEGKYSSARLKGKVWVQSSDLILTIGATDTNPYIAADIANSVAKVFLEENPSILNISGIEVLIPAQVSESTSPEGPNKKKYFIFAIAGAIFLGLVIAFLIEYFDNTLKNEEDIKKYIKVPVLGIITDYKKNSKVLLKAYKVENKSEEWEKLWVERKEVEKTKQINIS